MNGFDSPLFSALRGQATLARALIESGEEINICDENGNTPLHAAVKYPELVELLLKFGINPNAQNNKGQTALHCAVEDGFKESCRALINHDSNLNMKDNQGEQTPLHYAAWCGDYEIADLLIRSGADINAKDIEGQTPLHAAVWGNIEPHKLINHIRTATRLIQAGANINAITYDELTPLALAMRHKDYSQMHQLLKDNGAK